MTKCRQTDASLYGIPWCRSRLSEAIGRRDSPVYTCLGLDL